MRFLVGVLTIFAMLEPLFADSLVQDKITQAKTKRDKGPALEAEATRLIAQAMELRKQAEREIDLDPNEINSLLLAMNLAPSCFKEVTHLDGTKYRITFGAETKYRDTFGAETVIVEVKGVTLAAYSDKITFYIYLANQKTLGVDYSENGELQKVGFGIFGDHPFVCGNKN
jgi:hypothetical protein